MHAVTARSSLSNIEALNTKPESQARKVCPGCGTQWQCPVFKPKPSEEVAEPDAPTQSQPLAERPRKRLRSDKTVDAKADTNGFGPSQISVKTTRRSAR